MGIFGRIAKIFNAKLSWEMDKPTQEEIEAFEKQKIQNNITKDTKDYDFSNLIMSYTLFREMRILRQVYDPIPIGCSIKIEAEDNHKISVNYQIEFLDGKNDNKENLISNIIRCSQENNRNIVQNIKNTLLEHNFLGFKKDKHRLDTFPPRDNKTLRLKINDQEITFDEADYCYGEFDILYQKLEDILDAHYYFDKILSPFLK